MKLVAGADQHRGPGRDLLARCEHPVAQRPRRLIDAFLTYTPPANNQAFVDGIQNDPVAEGPLWKGNWPAFDKASNDKVTALMNGQITIDEYQNDDLQGRRHAGAFRVAAPATGTAGAGRSTHPRPAGTSGAHRSPATTGNRSTVT